MSLEGIFFISLSVEAIIVSLSLVILIFYFIKLMRELTLINNKVLEAAEESLELAEEAKEQVGKIGRSVVDYFIIKLLRNIKKNK